MKQIVGKFHVRCGNYEITLSHLQQLESVDKPIAAFLKNCRDGNIIEVANLVEVGKSRLHLERKGELSVLQTRAVDSHDLAVRLWAVRRDYY